MDERNTLDFDCFEVVLLAPWLANQTLAPHIAKVVRGHLIRCSSCRKEFRETCAVLAMHSSAEKPCSRSTSLVPCFSFRQYCSWPVFRLVASVVVSSVLIFVLLSTGGQQVGDLAFHDSVQTTGTVQLIDQEVVFIDDFEVADLSNWTMVHR